MRWRMCFNDESKANDNLGGDSAKRVFVVNQRVFNYVPVQ